MCARRPGYQGRGYHTLGVLGIGLLTVGVAAGCASPAPSTVAIVTPLPATSSPGGVTSPSATDPVDPCQRSSERLPERPTGNWGPLAVIPPQDGSDTARTEGTLRITDNCVFLDERGERVLLLWPADQTRWDAGERTVTFDNADGQAVVVRDGTAGVLGGGGDSSDESGIAPEAWLESMTWVARPVDGCPIDPWWGVGQLALN